MKDRREEGAGTLQGSVVEDPLTDVLREGAQRMLTKAIEEEVASFLGAHRFLRDEEGRQRVVRNGYLPAREIQTGIGSIEVRQPRIRDRASEDPIRFTSRILPPYLRKTRSLEELIPWLYLKGISTGDFTEALGAILGPEAPGLSPSTVARLKESWKADLSAWRSRDLSEKEYVYFWVDGVHFNARLEESRTCMLIVIGATSDGHKELVALDDGYRESEQSWRELLLDLKRRGLRLGPKVAVGDGALGFWKALVKVYGKSRQQRCWVHKTRNVLNYLPKSEQKRAKERIHAIWMAATRAEAEGAFDAFLETYSAKYPKATACLEKDRSELLTFYDFPAEHWLHLRTTNPVESTFATVRLRTAKTRGRLSRTTALTMVFRLALSAQRRWRKLNGPRRLAEVIEGIAFVDGVREEAA